ncbi:MAG: guanylate kinase, partial [Clostridiales bacterium]|nr:guanylate kinase [Clostridiales bacterium]
MNKKGTLIVISGFSGVGKGTVVKQLVETHPFHLSISATTRSPRAGEADGREYFFLTRDKFESMIEEGALIEWAQYVGNYYGTPRQYVMQELEAGNHVILEIEMQGALKIKQQFPEALLLFIAPPSADVLKERLVNRGTEDQDTIGRRLARAYEEVEYAKDYDYLVMNDNLTKCVDQINAIVELEEMRTAKNYDF